jgi:hypothetical protein
MRYGGNADVAGAAALLTLALGDGCRVSRYKFDERTGEQLYILKPDARPAGTLARARTGKPEIYVVTARELAHMARQAVAWLQYPYGDPGEPAVKDEKGKVVREAREPVRGYVSNMRDALAIPIETIAIANGQLIMDNGQSPSGRGVWQWLRSKLSIINYQLSISVKHFALPQVACNNLTWQQYRSLQAIAPQLFAEGIGEREALGLQAQFLAHILTPRSLALLDTAGGSIRPRPHYEYRYNAEQAEGLARWFEKQLIIENGKLTMASRRSNNYQLSIVNCQLSMLFHICFQAYQTALSYYAASYPLLFSDSGKTDPLRDALTGEVGTINTIMKYAGYAEQQQVYDSNLPFVLDILNTMTKEAKEIEKMNSKIKRK